MEESRQSLTPSWAPILVFIQQTILRTFFLCGPHCEGCNGGGGWGRMILVWVWDPHRWIKESFRTTFPSILTTALSMWLTVTLPRRKELELGEGGSLHQKVYLCPLSSEAPAQVPGLGSEHPLPFLPLLGSPKKPCPSRMDKGDSTQQGPGQNRLKGRGPPQGPAMSIRLYDKWQKTCLQWFRQKGIHIILCISYLVS